MSHADVLKKNYDVLQRCTTINFYVIDYLRAEDVLDEEQEHDLKTERNPLRQRILFYQWLKQVSPDKYESFLQVMKDTEQEHVANLLKGDTEEAYLPLSDARYSRLVKIRHKMAQVTRIDNELIAELRSQRAISMTDAEEIRAEKVESTRVSKLISVIMRRSNHSYDCFQGALGKTLQKAAANFLSEGEMPAVHLNNNRPDLDGPLSLAFNDVIRNGTENDAEINGLIAELNELGLSPANARPGESIVIFIYCKTVDSGVKFTQLFNSGRLQNILEGILNRLLLTIEPHNTKTLKSTINLEDEDVIALEEFTGIEGWIAESCKRQEQSIEINRPRCDASTQTEDVHGYFRKPIERSVSVLQKRKPFIQKPYFSKDSYSTFEAKDDDIVQLIWKLEETQKENDKLTMQLKLQSEREAWKQEDFYLKRKLEETQKDNAGLLKLLEYHTQRGENPVPVLSHPRFEVRPHHEQYSPSVSCLPPVVSFPPFPIPSSPERYKSDPILVQTIIIEASEKKNKWIKGLTILDKELFVVTEESSEVEVYDSIKFSFSRRWNLKELNCPMDLGSCNTIKCLYILNCERWKEILRVDTTGKMLKSWSTGENGLNFLSVTKESNVIVAVYDRHKLNEYSPDGLLIRELNLSSVAGIHHPTHAIQMANGHFLISHEDDDRHRMLSAVDSDGKLQKSLSGESKLIIGKMYGPAYLSVDGNGFVLVADRFSSRVLLLDSDMEFQREILSTRNSGLWHPSRIHLDEINGRLLVVDSKRMGQGISIFLFK